MKKLIYTIIICFMFLTLLTGCSAKSEETVSISEESTFESTVQESIQESTTVVSEETPMKTEVTFLRDDGMHTYYKVEPYKILDRFVKDNNGSLRKKFDIQVDNLNRIIAANDQVNFYVYVCTRMQDTAYSQDLFPNEIATQDYVSEFMTSIEGCEGIGQLDIDTMEKRKEKIWDTDHHWSAMGAYSAYVDVINMMKKDTPEIGDPLELNPGKLIVFDQVKARGSYANTLQFDEYSEPFKVLDINIPAFTKRSIYTPAYDIYKAGSFNKGTFADHYVLFYNNTAVRRYKLAEPNNERNLLLIGDSYTWWFSWLIASNFANVYIYLPPWDEPTFDYNQYIQDNNITDVLMMQFSDRLLYDYYNDSLLKRIKTN